MSNLIPLAPRSHDGTDSPAEAEDLVVVLNNFKSKIIKVKVSVKAAGVRLRGRNRRYDAVTLPFFVVSFQASTCF